LRIPLADVLPRLRCRRCRAAPVSVDLIDNPAAGAVLVGPAERRAG
jgi:hypothetical protein